MTAVLRWLLALAASALVACAHAQNVEPAEDGAPDGGAKQSAEGEKAKTQGTPREARKANDRPPADAVPIAPSPAGLLEPGAQERIQEALSAKDFDSLRAFQRAQDLPQTGVPDHETVRRLGLDPGKIFKRGSTP